MVGNLEDKFSCVTAHMHSILSLYSNMHVVQLPSGITGSIFGQSNHHVPY